VHGTGDVTDVDEVALDAETAEFEFAVAGLHGAAHGFGEAAERRTGRRAGSGGREDAEDHGVQAGAEDEFGGGQLADAVRAAGAGHGVLGGGGPGLAGPVFGAAAQLHQSGPAAAAA
jgi:hypothetical protein